MNLKGDIKVPVVGNLPKWSVYGGGVLLLGFGGWWYIKRRKANAAAATTTSTDTSTTDTSANTNPATDYSSGYGNVPYGYTGDQSGYDPYGNYDPNTGQYYYPGTGTPPSPVITTDAEWTQQVLSILSGNGSDPTAITSAIGLAFTGHCLTKDQLTLWDSAIAVGGEPPQPPTVTPHLCGDGGGGGGGTTKPKTAPAGTSTSNVTSTSATLNWRAVKGATSYEVTFTEGGTGGRGQTPRTIGVTGTSYHVAALHPRTSHTWHVAAKNSAGTGPASSTQHFTTAAAQNVRR